MSKSFTFTAGELRVAMILVRECLAGMGGERPADLEHDEYTWADPKDLLAYGYSKHEAAGYWSSLTDKGFLEDNNLGGRGGPEWCVATHGWRFIETIWDANLALIDKAAPPAPAVDHAALIAATKPAAKITYWVMYSENAPQQDGSEKTRTTQHYGTADLDTAKKTVREFRELASRGAHFAKSGCINAAWIEQETREAFDF